MAPQGAEKPQVTVLYGDSYCLPRELTQSVTSQIKANKFMYSQ